MGLSNFAKHMIAALYLALLSTSVDGAETIRIATFNTELGRNGPGLLLRDILKGDPQAEAVARVIADVAPDVIALQGIDFDADGLALDALADLISDAGVHR